MVPVAHASDGGGSIRIPASACGLVGLKPSRGRVPLWPEVAEGWGGMAVEGVVSRSVRDTAVMLDVAAGPGPAICTPRRCRGGPTGRRSAPTPAGCASAC